MDNQVITLIAKDCSIQDDIVNLIERVEKLEERSKRCIGLEWWMADERKRMEELTRPETVLYTWTYDAKEIEHAISYTLGISDPQCALVTAYLIKKRKGAVK